MTTDSACRDCEEARKRTPCGLYRSACPDCLARAIVHSPAYARVIEDGAIFERACADIPPAERPPFLLSSTSEDYRTLLAEVVRLSQPGTKLSDAHRRVRSWHATLNAVRLAAADTGEQT